MWADRGVGVKVNKLTWEEMLFLCSRRKEIHCGGTYSVVFVKEHEEFLDYFSYVWVTEVRCSLKGHRKKRAWRFRESRRF